MKISYVGLVCAFLIMNNNFGLISTFTEDKLRSAAKLTCSIQLKYVYKALGLFLSPIHVLTAASQLFIPVNFGDAKLTPYKVYAEDLRVGLGDWTDGNMNFFNVEKVHTYDDYDLEWSIHNIAILTVKDSEERPQGPFPVLPSSPEPPNVLFAMPFYNGTGAYLRCYHPLHIRLPHIMHVGIANLKMCTKAFYGKMHVDKDYHICGATAEDYTTLEDIGSPLLTANVVVGLYSYGACDNIHLYTNIYQEIEFIQNATNGAVRVCED